MQSSVIQEEDSKDESASGSAGHGKNQPERQPGWLLQLWGYRCCFHQAVQVNPESGYLSTKAEMCFPSFLSR